MVLRRTLSWSAGLTGLLVVTVLTSTALGYAEIGPLEVLYVVLNAIRLPTLADGGVAWVQPFGFPVDESTRLIVTQIRLPRILLGAIVGFALALAGAVMQGFFRNPMADPSIIGVSSGAAVGAVAFIVLPLSVPFGRTAAAFAGALVAAFAVYLIATEDGRTPVATLLLAGVALQTFLGAVISYLLLHAGDNLETAVYWLMGHLQDSTWGRVRLALPLVVFFFVVLLAYARDLNVLLLGEEDAHTLGIEVERTKRILLAASSLVTAAAVAVSGVIGFVGLIVPHMMRLLVGPDHRILLPTSALAGAVFLVATDTVARSGPGQLPVGIVTAALGAPFFLYLLRKREVHAL
ncbi:ABC-type transport system permease protein (probable substrate cobalamin) [Natronomonas pharaonis DSM 2160]|uniref:Cobalamin import system permease protein BtuC n=1 Tax=Natronomonas pharaonis (strain ATCC 35678 / DSM 2160 / CIP 103997 / JCM 8858 / NBRC 14720 / NCIMB 2260 / Gabara) TaxID=348780 RepID=A0A1U7EXS1_NATPD|nr:vitamin B12 ABC transporter permease BtuC [Natronomonas pharaonis]CAI49999.1 ABC-type transport system permease protein (probable substrate cobalamin) [Natronomonas pharaonis DSM 2160]